VDGGMVANNNFIQSLSNTLQKKIIKPKNIETTSLGVAYLAALSCGLLKNTAAITGLWKSSKIYKPKIKKSLMTNKIKEWQKIVSILTKNYP
jgi:glycerol kinase